MATATNALTLGNLAATLTDPLRKGVIMNLLRKSQLLERVPFETVSSLQVSAVRGTTLPSVAFRGINEGYTPSHGAFERVWEVVSSWGGGSPRL